MSLKVSDEEWERWERERRVAADADRDRGEYANRYDPPIWAPTGGELYADIRRALRGELAAQEAVDRYAGRVNLLRWYVEDLEALLAARGVELPAEVALTRRLALELPLFAVPRLAVAA